MHCVEGQTLLNTILHVREEVIPWGVPQMQDRILESVRQDWAVYQHKLSEVRSLLNTTLSRLRLMENKFLKVDEWLKTMEERVNFRTGRQSDRATKEMQVQQMKVMKFDDGHFFLFQEPINHIVYVISTVLYTC